MKSVSLVEIMDGEIKVSPFGPFKAEFAKSYNIIIEGHVVCSGENGNIFHFEENPIIYLEPQVKLNTAKQNSLLRAVETLIFYSQEGRKPKSRELHWIHEAVLEQSGVFTTNPITGRESPKRTSDPSLTSREMALIINAALSMLQSTQIPEEVHKFIFRDINKMFLEFYKWQKENESLDVERDPTICELTFEKSTGLDPVVKAHIISKGADETIYGQPWNWIYAKQSLHIDMHQGGWNEIIERFPHIAWKIKRAFTLGGANET
jgi:hypothetical protein